MTAAAVNVRDGQTQSDSCRPLSVSERRAFFERLQTSASMDISTGVSKSVDLCRSTTHRGVISRYKRFASCDKAIQAGNSEMKENVTPSSTSTELFVMASRGEPPAKPRRTFAHGRELLRQANVVCLLDENEFHTVLEAPTPSVNKPRVHPPRSPGPTRYLKLPRSSRHIAHIQQQLFSSIAACSRPPPLPPKPSLSPFVLKGRPTYFQLSHETDSPSSGNCTRASAHEQWLSDGHLVRYHSDESLYATPAPPRTHQHNPFHAQPMAQAPLKCGQKFARIRTEPSSFNSETSIERTRLHRAAPIIRRGVGRCRPTSSVAVVPLANADDRTVVTENSEEERDLLVTEKTDLNLADGKLRRRVTKAKLVHRRTLAFYDQQVAAFCRRMAPQLFDQALVVSLLPRNEVNDLPFRGVRSAYVPVVTYKYPEDINDRREHRNSAVECADLFIPDFTRARPYQGYEEWTGNEEFMLTLTDELGKRTFAYCTKFLPRDHSIDIETASTSSEGTLPEVFAIISPIHAPTFYAALARECVNYLLQGRSTLKNLLDAVFRRPFPTNGGTLCVAETSGRITKREIIIRSQGPTPGRADCSSVVQRMGVEVTVSVLAALLAEQKVLIGGDSVQSVCHAVQSLVSLLQPFSWPYTLVPVLPDTLLELANSPTPYLLGVLRNNLYKLKDLLVGGCHNSDDLMQDDVIIVDLDGGIFVPQPSELYNANQGADYKEKSALMLCEKLLLPKKLASNLILSFKEALAGGPGPVADDLLQKAMLAWLASLVGHYKWCGLLSSYLADCNGDPEPLRASLTQLVAAHNSTSARRFTEWFVETGIFRDWIRRRVSSAPEMRDRVWVNGEDAANQRLDELATTLAPQTSHNRLSHIFTRAHTALFRSHLLKKF
uniref:Suppression of tumorigenicity 5 protein n=1 Tax=Ascaris suum TaxID=6253 RepID=F1KW05_ASCSU